MERRKADGVVKSKDVSNANEVASEESRDMTVLTASGCLCAALSRPANPALMACLCDTVDSNVRRCQRETECGCWSRLIRCRRLVHTVCSLCHSTKNCSTTIQKTPPNSCSAKLSPSPSTRGTGYGISRTLGGDSEKRRSLTVDGARSVIWVSRYHESCSACLGNHEHIIHIPTRSHPLEGRVLVEHGGPNLWTHRRGLRLQ